MQHPRLGPPLAGRRRREHPEAALGRCGMGWGKVLTAVALLLAVACGSGKPSQQCDPRTDDSCNIGTSQARCTKDADCGDGTCQSDGTCKAAVPQAQATACAGVTCAAGEFCTNGQC